MLTRLTIAAVITLLFHSDLSALDVAPPGGQIELYRFASLDTFDDPMPIIVTRDHRVTTGVRLNTNQLDDYIVQYTPGGSVIQQVVPDSDRILQLDASRWGVAITVDQNGGTPMAVYAAPFGQPLQQIFLGTANGSNSEPRISDAGTVVFTGRMVNSHGPRDVWMWKPDGQPVQLLPDLNENSLGDFAFVDGHDRVTTTHQFNTPSFYTGIYRYDANTGWINLADGLGEPVQEYAGSGGKASNPRGDVAFITRGTSSRTLRLYQSSTNSVVAIADVTRTLFNGSLETRLTDVRLGDNGEVLAIIGGSGFDDTAYDVIFQTPSGPLDLEALLPGDLSLTAYPNRPRVFMSNLGRLLIEARHDITGQWSYHYYDYHSGEFRSPGPLNNLDRPVQWAALSDDGKIYYWRDQGAYTALYSLAIPEPAGFPMLVIALALARSWHRHAKLPN